MKGLQEFPPVARVILPRVFAVENHRNHGRPMASTAPRRLDAMVQIRRGGVRVHAGVDKSHQVGKLMVAEENGDGLSACGQGVRAIELVSDRKSTRLNSSHLG